MLENIISSARKEDTGKLRNRKNISS